ncbi:MAG: spermidine/putrescine ABC transporter ATP-binding protein [Ignavibacteria bacterium]
MPHTESSCASVSSVKLVDISKSFHTTDAVRGVNLAIRPGEFFSILGPSGSGKTTLLRLIAGFEVPDEGSILFDDVDVTRRLPRERGIGMVFQHYALFPHMTVFENVAFGLEARRIAKQELRRRVENVLDAVHLSEKAYMLVPHLSGGEQQRVALARALIIEPAVLLFNEPLSNLDVALRVAMREEIRTLQQRFKMTTVYVTHDQAEAMSLSDRIAVMRSGRVEQVGTPREVYESPRTAFIASFLGGANVLHGTVDSSTRELVVGRLRIPLPPDTLAHSVTATIAVKPEALALTPKPAATDILAVVRLREYLGFITTFVLDADGTELRATALSSSQWAEVVPGTTVGIRLDWSRCTFLLNE